MYTSLLFRLKNPTESENHKLVEIFFKAWVDESCNNEVEYKLERNYRKDWVPGMVYYNETFRVDFMRQEDALALKLRGVPSEFQKYLEIVS
jgi:hypothetical protein